jgi:hypothetical protein
MIRVEAARVIACKRPFVQRGAVEVDPDGEVAAVPTGIWVAAWVFVSSAEINKVTGEDLSQCTT